MPGTRIPCRVITDSADVAATAMGSILERMPRPVVATELPVTVFVCPSLADFQGFVVEQGDGVIYSEKEVVADVVLSGKAVSPSKILATVTNAAAEMKK